MNTDLWPWSEHETDEAERRERRVQRAMRVCVHTIGTVRYEAPEQNVCKAGVDWRTVEVRHDDQPQPAIWPPAQPDQPYGPQPMTLLRSVPCTDTLNCGLAACAKRETRTRDAAVAYVREETRRCDEAAAARPRYGY